MLIVTRQVVVTDSSLLVDGFAGHSFQTFFENARPSCDAVPISCLAVFDGQFSRCRVLTVKNRKARYWHSITAGSGVLETGLEIVAGETVHHATGSAKVLRGLLTTLEPNWQAARFAVAIV